MTDCRANDGFPRHRAAQCDSRRASKSDENHRRPSRHAACSTRGAMRLQTGVWAITGVSLGASPGCGGATVGSRPLATDAGRDGPQFEADAGDDAQPDADARDDARPNADAADDASCADLTSAAEAQFQPNPQPKPRVQRGHRLRPGSRRRLLRRRVRHIDKRVRCERCSKRREHALRAFPGRGMQGARVGLHRLRTDHLRGRDVRAVRLRSCALSFADLHSRPLHGVTAQLRPKRRLARRASGPRRLDDGVQRHALLRSGVRDASDDGLPDHSVRVEQRRLRLHADGPGSLLARIGRDLQLHCAMIFALQGSSNRSFCLPSPSPAPPRRLVTIVELLAVFLLLALPLDAAVDPRRARNAHPASFDELVAPSLALHPSA